MPVTKRTRYEVLRRDNHTCRYCGATAPDAVLTVDHVLPVSLGGSDDPTNLVAACRDCNAGKSSSNPDAPLVENVAEDAVRWAAATKLAAERAEARSKAAEAYLSGFLDEFERYYGSLFAKPSPTAPVLPDSWESSITTFYARGLPATMLARAVAIAASKPRLGKHVWFNYFAGVCWSMLTEIQEEAEKIIRAGGDA